MLEIRVTVGVDSNARDTVATPHEGGRPMFWETIEVPRGDLRKAIMLVRRSGGTITHCAPRGELVAVTYYATLPVARARRLGARPKAA
jgi:hypothetical protein